jgi:hypothetical protein
MSWMIWMIICLICFEHIVGVTRSHADNYLKIFPVQTTAPCTRNATT